MSTKSNKFQTYDAQLDYEFGSGLLVKLCRLAIRAAKFEPEAGCTTWSVSEIHYDGIPVVEKNEGPLRGHVKRHQ